MPKEKLTQFERDQAWAQEVFAKNKDLDYVQFARLLNDSKRGTNAKYRLLLRILSKGRSSQRRAAGKARLFFKNRHKDDRYNAYWNRHNCATEEDTGPTEVGNLGAVLREMASKSTQWMAQQAWNKITAEATKYLNSPNRHLQDSYGWYINTSSFRAAITPEYIGDKDFHPVLHEDYDIFKVLFLSWFEVQNYTIAARKQDGLGE
ncbi:hypothetical protein BX666DRAFT_1880394 [Dichotomocladium elegans]|nr:hypothetical protein BX666DRAFT_1880394 [Dichotomocladium elegans]